MGRYDEMTVNERLYEAGLVHAFDEAVKRRNRSEMVDILHRIELGGQAESIADSILAKPTLYGY